MSDLFYICRLFFRALFTFTLVFIAHQGFASEPGTLRIGVGRDFYDGRDSRAFLHGSTNTWESLTYLDENLRAIPWLAKSWEHSDDGRTWIFHLREDVFFHDGTLLTNEDAVASIRRIMSHHKYDPTENYRHVISVNSKGRHDLIFRLREPVPYFPKLIAYYSSPVIKPSCFDSKGNITKLIATGPYRTDRIVPGEQIQLSAFKEYRGPEPAYQKVVFRTIPDAQTRLMALISGEIDAVADVGGILPEQAAELRSFPDIVLKQREVATTHLILFNCGQKPFSEQAVRQWVSGLLNRSQLVRVFAEGAGIVAEDPYTSLSQDFAFGLIRPGQKSKPALPDGSGRKATLLLHGGTIQRWPYLNMAQVIQETLQRQGLPLEIEIREAGAYHEALKKREFDLAIQPYTLMTGDPDFFYSYWISSDAPRNCGWKNQEADQLIQEARHEMILTRRQEIYRNLEEIISQNLPLLPLYHDISLYAHRKNIGNFEMDHLFKPVLLGKGNSGIP